MGLLCRNPIRLLLQRRFPQVHDRYFEVTLIILLLVISGLSIAKHYEEETRKRALKNELDTLRNKANEGTFREFEKEQQDQVKAKLQSIVKKYADLPLEVIISYQSGDRNKELVAQEMVELFRSAGIRATAMSIVMFGRSKLSALEILANSKGTPIVVDIVDAIGSVLRGRVRGKHDDKLEDGKVELKLLGRARFLPDGAVSFE